MQGDEPVVAAARRPSSSHGACGAGRVDVREQRVDHRVADEMDASSRSIPSAARFSSAFSRVDEQDVLEMVGQHAVVLLGHRAVAAAQARLEMRDRDVELDRRERAGERRVHVAGDDDEVRPSRSSSTCSTPTSAFAVCSACVPEPTPRNTSGVGRPSWSRKTSDIVGVVVLARVDERHLELPPPGARGGRAPPS